MSEQRTGRSIARSILRYTAFALAALVFGLIAGVLVAQRISDGPMGPLAGGTLKSGPLVRSRVDDWTFADGHDVELQLVDPAGSRTTGAIVHAGRLYIPCDLGFVWRRIPDRQTRLILSVLWFFKGWHEDAERDARAVLRIAGARYEGELVRVTDPGLLATLRSIIEEGAVAFFGPLMDVPADPEAIWFFRVDSRSAA